MALILVFIGLIALAAAGWWLKRREKNQGEAVKQYVLETTELERRLALMNPQLARGEPLLPSDQAWLEKMLFERRITSDPTKWVRPDLGYDAISGTLGEFLASYMQSGGSPELLEIKAKQVHDEKIQRMIAGIGMPETEEQIEKWWTEHSMGATKNHNAQTAQLPGQRIYHAAVVRKPVFPALYEAA